MTTPYINSLIATHIAFFRLHDAANILPSSNGMDSLCAAIKHWARLHPAEAAANREAKREANR